MKHPNNQVILSGKLYNFRSYNNIEQKKYVSLKEMPNGLQCIWGYNNGVIFENNIITATNNNVIADSNKYFTFGNGKYFDLNETLMIGNSPRTFVLQITLYNNDRIIFIDGGTRDSSRLFALGWGYSTNQIFYHFYYNDRWDLMYLEKGSYFITFIYDGQKIIIYKNDELLTTAYTSINTSSNYNYRIGQYVQSDTWAQGEWKSNFCAIYDRVLTLNEIKMLNRFFN